MEPKTVTEGFMPKASLEEMLATIPPQTLKQKVSDEHLAEIAGVLINWKSVSPYLGINEAEEETIKQEKEVDAQRRALLRKWKSKYGPTATYRNLAKCFYCADRLDMVEAVCQTLETPSGSAVGQQQGSQPKIQASPHMDDSLVLAKENLQMIKDKFASLLALAHRVLQGKNIDTSNLQLFLAARYLPQEDDDPGEINPMRFISEVLDTAQSLKDIFQSLLIHGLLSYKNFHILRSIINEYGSDEIEVKNKLGEYEEVLTGYVLVTKMKDYLDAESYQSEEPEHNPELLNKLSFKVKANVTCKTMKYVNELWDSLAYQLKLPVTALLFHKVAEGCVEITWLVPFHLTHFATRQLQESANYFRKEDIFRVTIAGQCVYEELSARKEEANPERKRDPDPGYLTSQQEEPDARNIIPQQGIDPTTGMELMSNEAVAEFDVAELLVTPAKGIAGQVAWVKDLGAPHQFLYKRFPNWKNDRKTHMIPPVFTPQKAKTIQLALKGPVHYTDRADLGESIVYTCLEELGKAKQIGMFVVHKFHLKDVLKWNVKSTPDYKVPNLPSTTNEFDFIIFHHALGVITIEVKNNRDIQINKIYEAEQQLKASHDFIQEFAKFNMSEDTSLPHWKVIAMPSTKKLKFDRKAFCSLQDDTLLLFEEDLENLESFEQWWRDMFESTTVEKMEPQTEVAYEQVLSYTLMVCHLGPVTDSDYIADLSQSLDFFRHLKQGFQSYPRILEKEFPNFWSWCWDVLNKMDTGFNFGDEAEGPALKATFMKEHQLNSQQLEGNKGIKLLDSILQQRKYISGVTSVLDVMLVEGFAKKYLLFVKHTVVFINAIRQLRPMMTQWKATDQSTKLEKFPFSKLASVEDYNRLDRHLSRSTFMEGDEPTELDKEIFESLTCELRVKFSQLPIVMTTEQLAVFEGPMKQVIIGAPGTGKTELLKFKALQLESEMKACKIEKKILYIVGNGSPDPQRRPLLSHQIERFFKKSKSTVEVMTILLEEENPKLLEETKVKLREIMKSGEYGHVFIDEYWIGARPSEQEIILELVSKIPGYVWISSVFDYDQSTKKYEVRTKPLIDAVENEGGIVSRITQVIRATNTIVNFERDYSAFYQGRSHPYGTKEILGHSLEGLPITWATADSIDGMYDECLKFVSSTLNDPIAQISILKTKRLTLNPADILIVNFAVRTLESLSVTPSLETRLKSANIPIWSFGEDPELFMNCDEGKVTLLNSPTREDSTRLDGVEWPVVVVILPSGVLLNTAELAPNAERLRNYDTYISCFRTQVKLVIISDKWTDEKMFLKDIELKFK